MIILERELSVLSIKKHEKLGFCFNLVCSALSIVSFAESFFLSIFASEISNIGVYVMLRYI